MSEDSLDHHLDIETLRRFAARRLGREELFEAGWHLFLCDRCRELLPEAGPEAVALFERMFSGARAAYPGTAYGEVTLAVAEKLRRTGVEIERERSAAGSLWAELEKQPPSRRVLMVENSARFQTYGLAELLLTESRRGWSENPGRAEELAELALAVIYRLEGRLHGPALLNDLKAEAWSYVANCRRIRSDLRSVSEAFDIAEDFRARGTGDPYEEAEILHLKASFYRAQRQLHEALRTADRAAEIYRKANDRHAEGRVLINKATILWEQGEAEAAIAVLERAGSLVDPGREPRLLLSIKSSLVLYLNDVGRGLEARQLLPEARKLAMEVGGGLDRLRVLWVDGLVHRGLGRTGVAEAALRRAMAGFIEAEIGYNAALVALDLAGLYLETGRAAEARDLAVEMVPIFAVRDVHREALAALAIAQKAMDQGAATLAMIQEVASFLRRARHNPALRFDRAS
jgi:tetratricopeptide (TPR) repeat protein